MGCSRAVYQMLFLKAKALKDTKPSLALEILHHLRAVQPRDYDVRRTIGEIDFRKNNFGSALWTFYLLYIKRRDTEDLRYLLCSSIYSKNFRFFFGDMRIHAGARDAFVESVVDRLLRKETYHDHSVVLERSFSSDSQAHRYDGAAFESVSRKMCSSGLDIWRAGLFTDAVGPCGVSADKSATKTTHAEFNVLYRVALQRIKSGRVADGLGILLVAYNAGSCLGLLEFLKNHEKMEALYFLSRASPVFQRYYDEAMQAARNAKVQTLHLLLLGRRSSLAGELIEML